MPLIDIKCTAEPCGLTSEVMRPLKDWPAVPPCPHCGAEAERIYLPTTRSRVPAVIVYQMPDGSYRFPGGPETPATHAYDRQGGTRIELRGWQEVRPFEKHMNDLERRTIAHRFEREHQQKEAGARLRRSELYRQLPSMTDGGQAFARAVMQRNDHNAQHTKPRAYDPGFHVEAFSNTRSNRDEGRDAHGRKLSD
jgi:hypothetical protein